MKYAPALVLCLLLLQGILPAQPEIANKFVYRSQTYNGMTLPYRLFIPDGYSSADGGSTFGLFDSYTAATSPAPQTRRIGIGALPNSGQAGDFVQTRKLLFVK